MSTSHEAEIRSIIASADNPYKVLGLDRTADHTSVRRAYHRLMLKFHPDKNSNHQLAAEASRVITGAYEVLGDAERRRAYDTYGAEGLRFMDANGTTPSMATMLKMIALAFTLGLARIVIARQKCWMDCDMHHCMAWVRPADDADADVSEDERRERRRQRSIKRLACRLFAALLLSVVALLVVPAWLTRAAGGEGEGEESPLALFSPSPSAAAPTGHVAIDTRCVLEGLTVDDSLRCQRESRASSSPARGGVVRQAALYGGDAAAAERALLAWLRRRCEDERLLRSASLERFRETATLPRHTQPLTYKSPNVAPRRKFAKRKWRPRYVDTFSVQHAAELFTPSPWCSAALDRP